MPSERMPLAATLILMREIEEAAPELLMIERAATMAFAAGALVFPGGRVDPGDFAIAERLVSDASERDLMAARIAAIRETIEEAGVAVGLDPLPDVGALAMIRHGLAAGRPFGGLLEAAGTRIDPGVLHYFARWVPRLSAARRYDTFFFVAAAPEAPDAVAVDGYESVHALWSPARALIEDADAGHHRIIFPTRCNLERIARFAHVDDAKEDGLRHAAHIVNAWVEDRAGKPWICIPEGIGYPITARPLDSH